MYFRITTAALLAALLLASCGTESSTTTDKPVQEQPADKPDTTAAKPAPPLDESWERVVLPGGKEVAFPKDGYCAGVIQLLNADKPDFGKAFAMQGVSLAPGGGDAFSAESQAELSSLAAILSIAPHLKVQLEGPEASTTQAVREYLIKEGVEADRIRLSKTAEEGLQMRLSQ